MVSAWHIFDATAPLVSSGSLGISPLLLVFKKFSSTKSIGNKRTNEMNSTVITLRCTNPSMHTITP